MAKRQTSYEKLSGRDLTDTLAHRDVFEGQQLDRSKIQAVSDGRGRKVLAIVVGVLITVLAWTALSMLHLGADVIMDKASGTGSASVPGYTVSEYANVDGGRKKCTFVVDQDQNKTADTTCYDSVADVPVPQWHLDLQAAADAAAAEEPAAQGPQGWLGYLFAFTWWKALLSVIAGLSVWSVVNIALMKTLKAQNLMNDTSDINQWENDQRVALPLEVISKFDIFPDVGAHSSVEVSSLVSHAMLESKGLKMVAQTLFYEKDVVEDGVVVVHKGTPRRNADGSLMTKMMPMVDMEFGMGLYAASGVPDDKRLRKFFDPRTLKYNPGGKNREKMLGDYDTVAQAIDADWIYPDYEVQRPAGIFVVDAAPVNTMVLAITRGGKGQTYIEPMIDMWSRETAQNNMVINDPKGELLVKNYVRMTMRGYQVVQFNLINSMKTDIYNPLGMPVESAREGDFAKCALYVENIADVFFPVDGAEDPVWPTAANNAFKRAVYGLIDYYLEAERSLREKAHRVNMDPQVLENSLDEMWGKVTLYNCYQLFVQLSSKKLPHPGDAFNKALDNGVYDPQEGETAEAADARKEADKDRADIQGELWEGEPTKDCLSLYFSATAMYPLNGMRTLVMNSDNSLKAMANSEKMLASVYGIAITAMSFFTDPTISTLTSGAPSQNVDLGGLSFPRRMGVRFSPDYLKRNNLVGVQALWSAYGDAGFTQPLGKDFDHEDTVVREGWARYYFKGKFPETKAWIKLELVNPSSKMLLQTFYFMFTKGYQTNLAGTMFVTDPITGEKLVRNGLLIELKPVQADGGVTIYEQGSVEYPQDRLKIDDGVLPVQVRVASAAIQATTVRYNDKPKAVFLVTPPHLMKYAKLILILLKQLVDLNFDKSYMTKANQKPLYKTRYMLDELGNLQSEGKGITSFQTMLSIGLGQEQQFTLILQTLQQLRDVYGESVDKIVQGNCLPLTTQIATPFGWTTMGQVAVGDEVLTPFGTTTTVTDKYATKVRPVFELMLRDGSSVEACPDHLWPVSRWVSRLQYTGERDASGKRLYLGTGPGGKTMERIEETISTAELKDRIDKGRQVDLIAIDPVAYPEADLPVDPFVLGAILGDAHINEVGSVFLYCNDPATVAEIRRRGYAVVEYAVSEGACPKYAINGVRQHMRELGLAGHRSWEKLIPQVYLFGSVQQRIDLLRGLMDTDGTISKKGEMEFTSASPVLAEGVQMLIRSLGGRVLINVKTNVRYTSPNQLTPKEGRDAYRVQNIRLPKINPFLLERKAERWHDRTRGFNRVVSVNYLRDDVVQCIRVADERHLYVVENFIPTHNTSNIVFLKSNDDSMLETLEKMSGKRHVARTSSKTITKNVEQVIESLNVEGKVSYTMSTNEEPVISFNDMFFIPERNSMVFRAGDSPIWNRNEMVLPMSWRLFKDTIIHPGSDFSLQTIPTLSTAQEFDVRLSQPNFEKMLQQRLNEAATAPEATATYRKAYGYDDYAVARLDPDVYATEVMNVLESIMWTAQGGALGAEASIEEEEAAYALLYGGDDDLDDPSDFIDPLFQPVANPDQVQETARMAIRNDDVEKLRYAGGTVSRGMLISVSGTILGALDDAIVEVYHQTRPQLERDTDHFRINGEGSLCGVDGTVFIERTDESAALQVARARALDADSTVFADEGGLDLREMATLTVTDAFKHYLVGLESWRSLGSGEFDRMLERHMRTDDEED